MYDCQWPWSLNEKLYIFSQLSILLHGTSRIALVLTCSHPRSPMSLLFRLNIQWVFCNPVTFFLLWTVIDMTHRYNTYLCATFLRYGLLWTCITVSSGHKVSVYPIKDMPLSYIRKFVYAPKMPCAYVTPVPSDRSKLTFFQISVMVL